MIYLDNAATSFPKPPEVVKRVRFVLNSEGGNPGRGGHFFSRKADEEVYNCRKEIKKFFNAKSEENIVFTPNATLALNTCIRGLISQGDRILTTDYEHNSVRRPLKHLKNIQIFKVPTSIESQDKTLRAFEMFLSHRINFVVVSHASNVYGKSIPIRKVCEMAHKRGAEVILDASQSAGILDIDLVRDGIDYLCAPGHKGLYGPQGSGFMILNGKKIPKPHIYGGTGSASFSYEQPDFLPDMLESGTLNTPAIAGLREGIRFLKLQGRERLHAYEMKLITRAYNHMKDMTRIVLYTPLPEVEDVPVLSFNVKDKSSFEVANMLDEKGICVRAGYHCSPDSHKKLGTLEHGTVRISVGAFNTPAEIDKFAEILQKISK